MVVGSYVVCLAVGCVVGGGSGQRVSLVVSGQWSLGGGCVDGGSGIVWGRLVVELVQGLVGAVVAPEEAGWRPSVSVVGEWEASGADNLGVMHLVGLEALWHFWNGLLGMEVWVHLWPWGVVDVVAERGTPRNQLGRWRDQDHRLLGCELR